MKIIFISTCILISAIVVFTEALALKNAYGPSIIEGDCNRTSESDVVFYDHVYKNAIPLFTRSETEVYSGNRTIYCIQALNQKSVATGGNAYITYGGVNLTYATIELQSFTGHGLDFNVSIYARNGTRQTSPMAVALEQAKKISN